MGPPRSPMDQPRPSVSSSIAQPPSFSADPWDRREDEVLLIKVKLIQYRSHGVRSQDPDSMQQCHARVFEFVKHGPYILTRRIVIRSCEDEQKIVSYCKVEQISIDIQVLSNNFVLIIAGQGCIRMIFMSRAKTVKQQYLGQIDQRL